MRYDHLLEMFGKASDYKPVLPPDTFIPPMLTDEFRYYVETVLGDRWLHAVCEYLFMTGIAALEKPCTDYKKWHERFRILDWIFASNPKHEMKFDNVCTVLSCPDFAYDPDEIRDYISKYWMTEEEKGIWL